MRVWWCLSHKSRGNPVLDAGWEKGEHLEMWAGCHDSLWSFASGMGDGGNEDKVGRCRMVPMRLIADNAETVERIAKALRNHDMKSSMALAVLKALEEPS